VGKGSDPLSGRGGALPGGERVTKRRLSFSKKGRLAHLIVICALKIPVGAHAGDSGWPWIFRALFFIFLGIKLRHLLSMIEEVCRFVF
jgi:hypothetical protein